jgi:hypothetical protein
MAIKRYPRLVRICDLPEEESRDRPSEVGGGVRLGPIADVLGISAMELEQAIIKEKRKRQARRNKGGWGL